MHNESYGQEVDGLSQGQGGRAYTVRIVYVRMDWEDQTGRMPVSFTIRQLKDS